MDFIDEIIEKIKKCVRLANKTSEEGERTVALAQARRLAEKHNISFEDIEVQDQQLKAVKVDDEKRSGAIGSELGFICTILKEHFGVVLMVNQSTHKKWSVRYSWFGERLNIDIARHVFHILRREANARFNKVRTEYEELVGKKMRRKSFMAGFFSAIYDKLTKYPIRNDKSQFEKENIAAEKAFEKFKQQNDVQEGGSRKMNHDYSTITLGYAQGDKVNLARPCEVRKADVMAIENK